MKFVYTQPKTNDSYTNDCMIRAVSIATCINYNKVLAGFILNGWHMYKSGRRSGNRMYDETLKLLGVKFNQYDIDPDNEHPTTLCKWVNMSNDGRDGLIAIYILPSHACCVIDGVLYDTFDCSDRIVKGCWEIL